MPTLAEFVRKMLAGHSALGLAFAAVMYLVCLSGTLSVFYQEFERWEQPTAAESLAYSPRSVATLAREALAAAPKHGGQPLYISLPTEAAPRLTASIGENGWIAHADGTLQQPQRHDWTHFLLHLHIYLHLEGIVGLTLVGIAGAMLFALIVSGLLAHPNILRDAFVLRFGGSARLTQTDLHNRLSVWGLPFHLAIAITGAFIGLSSALIFVVATAFYGGDTRAAGEPLFGPEPSRIDAQAELPDLATALQNLAALAPDRRPNFIVIDDPGTAGQLVTINTDVPRRLVYSERYTFDVAGAPTGTLGLADGPAAKQIYASVYPVHFGNFGGLPVKFAYALLGFALCAIAVTGVNVWIEKRRQARHATLRLDAAWRAVIWGSPLAIAASAIASLASSLPPTTVFWTVLLGCVVASRRIDDRAAWSRRLRVACGVACAAVPVVHAVEFGVAATSPAAIVVNTVWTLLALAVLGSPWLGAAIAPRSTAADSGGNATSSLRGG